MFGNWQQEKAIQKLVDEAQAVATRLDGGKAHHRDGLAAAVRFWAAQHLAEGQDLHALNAWKPAEAARFAKAAATKIAALRKARDYDSSDGLAVWMHMARAVGEPRIAPAVRAIWQQLAKAGPNADAMALDMMQEAGLPPVQDRRSPTGVDIED